MMLMRGNVKITTTEIRNNTKKEEQKSKAKKTTRWFTKETVLESVFKRTGVLHHTVLESLLRMKEIQDVIFIDLGQIGRI